MKLKKQIAGILAVALCTTGMLAGCGTKKDVKKEKLLWYIVGSEQVDLKMVNDEMNKTIGEKLGAELDIKLLDWNAYDQKMNLIISTKEPFDLCWTAPQFNDYYNNVARGAFVEVDELLDKYAPQTKAAIKEDIWNAAKIKGKLYGVLNYQVMATAYGFRVEKEVADASGVNLAEIKSFKDIEPLLAYAKANYPDRIPLAYTKGQDTFSANLPLYGFEAIGAVKSPGAIKMGDSSFKVVNQFETPEFEELILLMRDWYTKGYLKADAATSEEYNSDLAAGKIAVLAPSYMNDNIEDNPEGTYSNTGKFYYEYPLTRDIITTDRALATMTAISSTSKNPELAMQFIELMNTDEYLYNTMCYGIEGKHYKKLDYINEKGAHVQVEPIAKSGYEPMSNWMFGNTKNGWLPALWAPHETWEGYNANAICSDILGFAFDTTPVTDEIAICSSIVEQYIDSLASGTADPVTILPEFRNKLKTAGADIIVAEKQRQLDEWLKTR